MSKLDLDHDFMQQQYAKFEKEDNGFTDFRLALSHKEKTYALHTGHNSFEKLLNSYLINKDSKD